MILSEEAAAVDGEGWLLRGSPALVLRSSASESSSGGRADRGVRTNTRQSSGTCCLSIRSFSSTSLSASPALPSSRSSSRPSSCCTSTRHLAARRSSSRRWKDDTLCTGRVEGVGKGEDRKADSSSSVASSTERDLASDSEDSSSGSMMFAEGGDCEA